ncbi:MAG: thioredoxin family protein, partial [Chitinophagaceae bacterium]|nr:thioredoxin family protein [Chitinophagaceae bacterium]
MKRILFLIIACIATLMVDAQSVKFESSLNWEQMKAKAKKENKLIFLDIIATWCGPCKMMDKDVYANDTVGDYLNSKFLSVKIQMDKTDKDDETVRMNYGLADQLKAEYKVTGVPTYLFFNTAGQILHRGTGYMSTRDFIDLCKTAADPSKNLVGRTTLFKKKTLQGKDLLILAVDLKKNGQDSMAWQLAKTYKKTV